MPLADESAGLQCCTVWSFSVAGEFGGDGRANCCCRLPELVRPALPLGSGTTPLHFGLFLLSVTPCLPTIPAATTGPYR